MKQLFLRKLHNTSGESIAETLVAMLITVLASLMFAMFVSTSTKIVAKSEVGMDEYYQNLSDSVSGTSRETGTLTYRSSSGGTGILLGPNSTSSSREIEYQAADSDKSVIIYRSK